MKREMCRIRRGSDRSRLAFLIVATAIATIAAWQLRVLAQSDGVGFDVVSVKIDPSPQPPPADPASGERSIGGRFLPGRFVATYVNLRYLIAMAYYDNTGRRVRPTDIEDGPPWMDSLWFNIEATFNPELLEAKEGAVPARALMLQRLLADRFGLRVRFETRDTERLDLVMARADRRPGPRLRRASGDCVLPTLPPGGLPASAKPPNCPMSMGTSSFAGASIGLDMLAGILTARLGTKVVNGTGLDGVFDIALEWTPDRGGLPPATGETLYSALEHQLGIKLERRRGPAEVLVVEAAERPIPN